MARKPLILVNARTKKALAILKAEKSFRSFDDTINFLFYIYNSIPEKERLEYEKKWNEKKSRKEGDENE